MFGNDLGLCLKVKKRKNKLMTAMVYNIIRGYFFEGSLRSLSYHTARKNFLLSFLYKYVNGDLGAKNFPGEVVRGPLETPQKNEPPV